MSLLKLAWKNIIHNPLSLLLNLILLTLGIGLINFILLVNHQLKDKFDKNLAEIDLVIGAKGSPLQLILSSMYHIDAPTGNMSIKEAKPFLREGHPLIKRSVPLSMGDSYKGYRIIGTDYSILELYDASIKNGKKWQHIYEATIGASVASDLGLTLGSTFKSSHGFNDDEDLEHEHGTFTVVGILNETGSVIDQLILCNTESVWDVHNHDHGASISADADDNSDHDHSHDDHSGHDHDGHDHSEHDHSEHDHDHGDHDHDGHDHDHDGTTVHDHTSDMSRSHLLEHEDQEITSILIQYKSKTNFQALSMPRNINQNTDLQAAAPAYEINRLYDMMGTGTKALQLIAYLIAIVSAISIFVSLLNSLKQRKYELSLLRVLGGNSKSLFSLILLEGFIMAILGYLLGMFLSNLALSGLTNNLSEKYNYQFESWIMHGLEIKLLAATILLGLIAALIPAILAYKTDIHKNLSHG
ncbi:MAG: ABC transporter permease [Saprospiraceae bacterium]|nr:ABC transporter permease [Bacteroidia bacterium]NNE13584.1 ABC transporter permease [Saprospiraceae bacterium]NNL92933.1 ABC transporter permease [Saprospiraceae bacterium]